MTLRPTQLEGEGKPIKYLRVESVPQFAHRATHESLEDLFKEILVQSLAYYYSDQAAASAATHNKGNRLQTISPEQSLHKHMAAAQ